MMKQRFCVSAVLGFAGLLLGADAAQAQNYFYGYYYPDQQMFYSPDLRPMYQFGPPWFMIPSSAPRRVQTYSANYYSPDPASLVENNSTAGVRVIVPNPQARVWFDGRSTNSTGTERFYQTPALTSGTTYQYHVKATWRQDDREVTQERTVVLTPGQTTVVDFSSKAGG